MQLKNQDLISINNIIHEMNASANYRTCFKTVVQNISRLFKVERCSLMILSSKNRLVIQAAKGMSRKVIKEISIKPGEGIAGKILKTGKAVLVKNIEKEKFFKKKNSRKYFTLSFLSAPLKYKQKVIGVINVNNKQDKTTFTAHDLALLEPLLVHIAVVIKNSQLIGNLRQSNTALNRKVAMITTLFELTQEVIKKGNIFDLLDSLLGRIVKILNGSSGSLMLYNTNTKRLEIRASKGLKKGAVDYAKKQVPKESLANWVFRMDKSLLLVGEFTQHPTFDQIKSVSKIKSILSVPLTVGKKKKNIKSSLHVPVQKSRNTIGVINVNRKIGTLDFSQEDLNFLSILSYQIALAVENADFLVREKNYLSEITETKEKLERAMSTINEELDIAGTVQHALLPKKLSGFNRLNISAHYKPSHSLGGDLYDVIRIDDKKTAILIMDVSGHGVPAALVTVMAKMSFHASILNGSPPKEVFFSANNEIFKQLEAERYLTSFLGILDLEKMEMAYSNAAHPYQFLLHPDGSIDRLLEKNLGVGMVDNWDFVQNSTPVRVGDKIITFTDGLIECSNPQGQRIGIKQVEASLTGKGDYSAQRLVEFLLEENEKFINDEPLHDDLAVMVVEIQ